MKEFSEAKRLILYKSMLSDFYEYVGFCAMFNWIIAGNFPKGYSSKSRLTDLKRLAPEIYKYKPETEYNDEYWFPLGDIPENPRRQILETIIAEMEKGGQQ